MDLEESNQNLIQLGKVLEQLIGPDFISYEIAFHEATLRIYSASIVRVLTLISNHTLCDFRQLIDVTAIDYPERLQRFEVVYHLLSLSQNQRIRVKIDIGENCAVPSITPIFINANWYEREIWDLFGITFSDHPDLRRILTDYTFSGHPLRKDFPLTGYTTVRYCEKEKRVIYESSVLKQEYRTFDFLSPWEGNQVPHTAKVTLQNAPLDKTQTGPAKESG